MEQGQPRNVADCVELHNTETDNEGPQNMDKANGIHVETGQLSVENNGDHENDHITLNDDDEEHRNIRVVVNDEKEDLMPSEFWNDIEDGLKKSLKFSRKKRDKRRRVWMKLDFLNIFPRTADNTDKVDDDSDEEYEQMDDRWQRKEQN